MGPTYQVLSHLNCPKSGPTKQMTTTQGFLISLCYPEHPSQPEGFQSRTTPEKSSDTITLGYQTTDGTGMNLDLAARSLKPRCLDAEARPSHLVHFIANAPTPSFYTVNFLEPNSLPYGRSYYSWFSVNSTETNGNGMQYKKYVCKHGNKA